MSGTLISFNDWFNCGAFKRHAVKEDYKGCFPVTSRIEWELWLSQDWIESTYLIRNVSWPIEEGEFRKCMVVLKCVT